MEKEQRTLSSLRDKMSYMDSTGTRIIQFWDAVCLKYRLPLKRLSSNCNCSKPYNLKHGISCKKDEFVTLGHDE